MPENNCLSASLGSGTVSKTDSRGFDTSRRCLALVPYSRGWRGSLTSTQRSRHFSSLVSVVRSARRTRATGPTATLTPWRLDPTHGGDGAEEPQPAVNRTPLRGHRGFDSLLHHQLSAPVAQRTEQRLPKPRRAGSNPAGGSGAAGDRAGGACAVVVNSADTSVFQTEAEGSMPSDRSFGLQRVGLTEGRRVFTPDGTGSTPVRATTRQRRPGTLPGVRCRGRVTPPDSGSGESAFESRASDNTTAVTGMPGGWFPEVPTHVVFRWRVGPVNR